MLAAVQSRLSSGRARGAAESARHEDGAFPNPTNPCPQVGRCSSKGGYIYLVCGNALLLSSCWLQLHLFIQGRLHSLGLEEECVLDGGVVMARFVHSTPVEGVGTHTIDAAS